MMYSCAPSSRGETTRVVKKRGKSLRVDIHCHYMNTEVAAKVAHLNPAQHEPMAVYSNAASREANAQQVKERGQKLTDIAVRLKDMDRMGIDIQAVSPAPHQTYYWTDPGMGQELARAVNQRLAEIVSQHPDRFVALGTVPLQDASLAVSELTHCVKTLGMRGVEINPSVKGMDLTDAKLGSTSSSRRCRRSTSSSSCTRSASRTASGWWITTSATSSAIRSRRPWRRATSSSTA